MSLTVHTTNEASFLVDDESHDDRLDRFIVSQLENDPELSVFSRERIQSLIRSGQILINAKPALKASLRLKEGDTVAMRVPEAEPIELEAEDIPLSIIYEDTDLLVVNKSAGMLTHPTGKERQGTLVNALLAHCGNSLSGINGKIRPGIVHRLDRDTAGLLMVAKNDAAHLGLSAQIKAKTARRDYRAIVQGVFDMPNGTIDVPIGRNPKQRDKMGVDPLGRPARTHWRILETIGNKFSLLELSLETGRTHQIRVHCAHKGHPLVGDPLYGTGLERQLRLKIQGQQLQAFRLAFRHPLSDEPLSFEIETDPEICQTWSLLQF